MTDLNAECNEKCVIRPTFTHLDPDCPKHTPGWAAEVELRGSERWKIADELDAISEKHNDGTHPDWLTRYADSFADWLRRTS